MLSCEKVESAKLTKKLKVSNNAKEDIIETQDKSEKDDLDTKCGLGFIQGKWIQKLASKKSYLFIHAITAMIYSASFHYYSGILTTLEKQFKFSSAQMGYIGSIYDIVATVVSLIMPYYCSRGSHRFPRWMGFAVFCFGISFIISLLPAMIYNINDDILSLTKEYDELEVKSNNSDIVFQKKMKELCYENRPDSCIDLDGSKKQETYKLATFCFILACVIEGFGESIFNILGATYIDNNVKKSRAPILYCLTSFVRLLGPALGFSLASFSLKQFVNPKLHPKINDEDPRWIGGWWIGYIFFAIMMFILSPIIMTFPKVLPRAAVRRREELEKLAVNDIKKEEDEASMKDLLQTFKRLLKNKVFFFNTMAAIFYCFGYIPFFFFQSKYIQIHFLFSPSTANLITGTVTLVFAAIGLLSAGIVITIFKPPARYLAMWNIFSSLVSIVGIIAYGFFSCTANENSTIMQNSQISLDTCSHDCNCDYVKFSPLCGENNVTYISACHAGCIDEIEFENGTKLYTNCKCINNGKGKASSGACSLDCMPKFIMFLSFLCLNKFIGGTEGAANFLLGVRCVEKKDKAVSIGLSMALISFFAVATSPTFFGWIIDETCIFWGKNCNSAKGNCWLYNTESMRYNLNMTAAAFVFIGTCFDIGTWKYSKDVQIFDENEEK